MTAKAANFDGLTGNLWNKARLAIERKTVRFSSLHKAANCEKVENVIVIGGLGRFLGFFDQLLEQSQAVLGFCHHFEVGLIKAADR